MKCPMTFGDPCADRNEECRSDCAWRIKDTHGNYGCAVSALAVDVSRTKLKAVNFEKLRAKVGE